MIKKTQFVLEELYSISPLDGRYRAKIEELTPYVSEYALIKNRVEVEISYLRFLAKYKVIRAFSSDEQKLLDSLIANFTLKNAHEVKEIELETRHDVKAVERFLREKLSKTSLKNIIEMIHFGLTSEDINNISYRLMLKRGTQEVLIPALEKNLIWLLSYSEKFADFPMLSRTHGQAAVPTTLGKELVVFASRLHKEIKILKEQNLTGKLNGAVGNYNALQFASADIDWTLFSEEFINSLGFDFNLITTQINTYEDVTSYLQTIFRINCILADFDQDMWRYISDDYFMQEFKSGEVGSSTMPQKVNPIDFENSEGNIGLSNALIELMIRKLPISRLQRDLTDSTVIRNVGTVLGYSLIAYKSLDTGLGRVKVHEEKILEELEKDWSILTEGIQTYLRKIGVKDPYVLIAKLSKGKKISQKDWEHFIKNLPVTAEQKKHLETLSPKNYIGLAEKITLQTVKEISSKI